MPLTLYHGTLDRDVDDIRAGIRFLSYQASDFNASDHVRAFYCTPDLAAAEHWARIKADWAAPYTMPPYRLPEPVVIEFSLNTTGLNIFDFGTGQSGSQFQAWQTASALDSLDHGIQQR
jgi:hypothetical protein